MFAVLCKTDRVEISQWDEQVKIRKPAEDQLLLIKEAENPKALFRRLRNYIARLFVGAARHDTLLDNCCNSCFASSTLRPSSDCRTARDQSLGACQILSVASFIRVRADFAEI